MESPYFNTLLQHVAQDARYNTELTAAKQEFEGVAGAIFETDRSYDARINAFHNWYILDRPLQAQGVTPLRAFLEHHADTLPEAELAGYRELELNLHSVFEVVRFTDAGTRVRDVVSRRKYDVEGTEGTEFIDKGTLFNTRLFRHGGRWYFSNYFLLHPEDVSRRIKAEAKQVRKGRQDGKAFLFRLVLFQSRWDQYQQMQVHNIYRFGA